MIKCQHKKIIIFFFTILLLSIPCVYADIIDPTRPTGYADDGNDPLQLNAVIISATTKVAIIGGISVKIGDDISGNRITEINSDSVIMDGPDGKIVLYLTDKNLKHASD